MVSHGTNIAFVAAFAAIAGFLLRGATWRELRRPPGRPARAALPPCRGRPDRYGPPRP
jgi:hypothetical protein